VWVVVAVVVVAVVADVSVVTEVVAVSVPVVVIVVSVAIVSEAIVSEAIVSEAVMEVSVAAVSVVASSFLQPTASIETTKRAARVMTRDFFMRNSPSFFFRSFDLNLVVVLVEVRRRIRLSGCPTHLALRLR
jgi:hypothetical protein